MSGRLVRLVHTRAEDLLNPLQTGAVMAAAQFYIPAAGWTKIQPGRLGLADLWGGGVRDLNREGTVPSVEFYIGQNDRRVDSYVAVNGDTGDIFSFVAFGRRL